MVVLSGFSPAREVRWGIRSYSSVRVGGCAPLEIFGASCSGFDSAPLHQCGLWPRQHHSGLAQAVGQCLPYRAWLQPFSCLSCWYSSNRYMAYAPIGLNSAIQSPGLEFQNTLQAAGRRSLLISFIPIVSGAN